MGISSTPVYDYSNPTHLYASFPYLFPYGIGGVQENYRKIKISYREQIKYMLSLNDNRFSTDRHFPFVTFNIIQKYETRQSIYLMIQKRNYNKITEMINRLTIDDLNNYKKNLNEKKYTLLNTNIKKCLNLIYATSGKIQGSRFKMNSNKNELKGYIIRFGMPSFFITLNLADTHNSLLFFLGNICKEIMLSKNIFRRALILKNTIHIQHKSFETKLDNYYYFLLYFHCLYFSLFFISNILNKY